MTDVGTFLLHRIAEDEQVARAANPTLDGIADGWFTAEADQAFIQHFTSARMLADAKADRDLIDRLTGVGLKRIVDPDDMDLLIAEKVLDLAVRIRAERFATHHDYLEEWRP